MAQALKKDGQREQMAGVCSSMPSEVVCRKKRAQNDDRNMFWRYKKEQKRGGKGSVVYFDMYCTERGYSEQCTDLLKKRMPKKLTSNSDIFMSN